MTCVSCLVDKKFVLMNVEMDALTGTNEPAPLAAALVSQNTSLQS